MKKMQQALLIAGLLLYAIAAFLVGFKAGREYERARLPLVTVVRDTVTEKDSLPYYYPVPKDSAVIRYVTVAVPGTPENVPGTPENVPGTPGNVPELANNDNLFANNATSDSLTIPIERRVYQEDSAYYAVVTGPALGDYHPSLDTLLVYRTTTTITQTNEVTSYKAFRWSVGPFVSQEVGLNHYAAKVGVAGDFGLGASGRWRFQPEAGHYFMPAGVHDWYAGARLRYDLFRKR